MTITHAQLIKRLEKLGYECRAAGACVWVYAPGRRGTGVYLDPITAAELIAERGLKEWCVDRIGAVKQAVPA